MVSQMSSAHLIAAARWSLISGRAPLALPGQWKIFIREVEEILNLRGPKREN